MFCRKRQQELQYAGGMSDPGGWDEHNTYCAGVYHGHPSRTRGGVRRQWTGG